MIVAINKIDKKSADPNKVRTDLLQHEVVVEKMSGDVLDVEVSAGHRAGPGRTAGKHRAAGRNPGPAGQPEAGGIGRGDRGEAGRGPRSGRHGAGAERHAAQGRHLRRRRAVGQGARADQRQGRDASTEAGPSVPVEVLGLNGTPQAGDTLNVVETEAQAREIATYREKAAKDKRAAAGCRDHAGTADGEGQGGPERGRTADRGEGRRAGLGRGDRSGDGKDRQRRGPRARAALRRRRDHRHRRGPGRSQRRAGHRLQRSGQCQCAAAAANQKGVEIRYYS